MILSKKSQDDCMEFVRDLIEHHLCENDKSFFRYRKDVNGCISALRKSLEDNHASLVFEELFQYSEVICQYQMMCAILRGIRFGVYHKRAYVPEDGKFSDISGYSRLIFIDKYTELQRKFSRLETEFRLLVTEEKFMEYKHCMDRYVMISRYVLRQSFNIANDTFVSWEKKYCGNIL